MAAPHPSRKPCGKAPALAGQRHVDPAQEARRKNLTEPREAAAPAHRHASRDKEPHQAGRDLRSYGRRRGRALSPRQKALWQDTLPRVALPRDARSLATPPALFTPTVSDVWLEIGFGGGEHLIWQAAQHPDVGLIGCEPFEDGVVKVLSAIDTGAIANIKVHADDARPCCACCRTPASAVPLSCSQIHGPRSATTSAA